MFGCQWNGMHLVFKRSTTVINEEHNPNYQKWYDCEIGIVCVCVHVYEWFWLSGCKTVDDFLTMILHRILYGYVIHLVNHLRDRETSDQISAEFFEPQNTHFYWIQCWLCFVRYGFDLVSIFNILTHRFCYSRNNISVFFLVKSVPK